MSAEFWYPTGVPIYQVGPGEHDGIMAAYRKWREDKESGEAGGDAIIEITRSIAYQEQIELVLDHGDQLEVRAAEGTRPVIRLLDWYSNRPDALIVRATETGCQDECGRPKPPRLVLDGLLITGRGVHVSGPMGQLVLRHSTLVPGWTRPAASRRRCPDRTAATPTRPCRSGAAR